MEQSSRGTIGAATRYPGVQPFADDELSRKLFFGREQAATDVTNQILANRLLVLYAQSGLGKTSLLHAGVSPRLRQEAHLPLRVRVNDAERGALRCVFEGVVDEARRQGVEYVAGTHTTLWSFFKTLELWRGDTLLIPVLVLDQFEELFTLQGEASRRAFLDQLGFLVRGVCPPAEAELHASLKPPALRIVLSLREDFLGVLEEAANQIPQILDRRYRLAPLSLEAAQEALIGPARLEDAEFASPPFQYAPEALQLISGYLSQRRRSGAVQATVHIEPFHLQLVCQRMERLILERSAPAGYVITQDDVGGVAGLDAALKDFYLDTLRALPRAERRLVERLCREHLISDEARRVSLEEGELEEHLGVSAGLLRRLVQCRLLRTELRADSSYYELSHDTLVEPVLAQRRKSALTLTWLQLLTGAISLLFVLIILITRLLATKPWTYAYPDNLGFALIWLILVSFAWWLVSWLRAGWRRLVRYHAREELEPIQPQPGAGL